MVLKEVVAMLIIFKIASSLPEPDININVDQYVELGQNSGCCPGSCCPDSGINRCVCDHVPGWHKFEGQCYYFVLTDDANSTWPLAQLECHAMGNGRQWTDLAEINNLNGFYEFMAKIPELAGYPYDFWLVSEPNGGCYWYTWDTAGKPYIKTIPCDQGGSSYICQRSCFPI